MLAAPLLFLSGDLKAWVGDLRLAVTMLASLFLVGLTGSTVTRGTWRLPTSASACSCASRAARDVDSVLAAQQHIDPPALTLEWGGHPTAPGLASEILERRLDDSRAGDLEAINAIAQAWELGRDIVWDAALRAGALRSLGRPQDARPFEQLYEGRLRMLADVARPTEARRAQPYVRPASPADQITDTAGRSAPRGWVVEPIGTWESAQHEVVYDPRRHEVTVTESAHDHRSIATPGWQLQATDGSRGFWTLDRVAAARGWLNRFEQLAMGIEGPQPATATTREPTRDLGR